MKYHLILLFGLDSTQRDKDNDAGVESAKLVALSWASKTKQKNLNPLEEQSEMLGDAFNPKRVS